ncbi:hypothetical protein BDR22DRAFT_852105 [Usnea florida]
MFGFDDASQAHNDVYGQDGPQPDEPDNQGHFSHELLAGAAGFEAMRKYQQHEQANGVAENHTFAKDILAGFAGGEADKLVETKGEDFYDREKLKRDAQQNASQYYDQQYQGGGGNQGGGGDSGYGDNQGGGGDSGY